MEHVNAMEHGMDNGTCYGQWNMLWQRKTRTLLYCTTCRQGAVVCCVNHSYMSHSFSVMHEGRRRKKKKEEGRKTNERTKSKYACQIFFTVRRIDGILGAYFTLE